MQGTRWIHFLGTFPPRECGIATFTKDLSDAIEQEFYPKIKTKIVAMNENSVSTYNYPKKVTHQIDESVKASYRKAAKALNESEKTKVVCIQHEFGIFGGNWGDYLLYFLKEIKKPVFTTFHSIIPYNADPDRHRKNIIKKIVEHSKKVIVISGHGKDILLNDYGIKDKKVEVIPHGIPLIERDGAQEVKEELGFADKTLLCSFGLLNRGKGLEYVIRALPKILEKNPNVVYLIVGETHPVVRREEGESYRNKLKKEIAKLGLDNHVKFYNKYLSLEEICKYLKAVDIYVTPYFDPNQVSSGTLAYAFGAGKACISTPYLFAEDILRDGRGILVRYKNSRDIAKAVNTLLEKENFKKAIEDKAFAYSRSWLWPAVARSYMNLFEEYL